MSRETIPQIRARHREELETAIHLALGASDGDQRAAARALGVAQSTLAGMIRRSPALSGLCRSRERLQPGTRLRSV
jgi:hypothetical protein